MPSRPWIINCAIALATAVSTAWAAETDRVTVSGVGEVKVAPDAARFQAGFQITRPQAHAALEETTRVMEALRRIISRARVEDRHVQTARFDVSARHENRRRDRGPELIGYHVQHVLSVTLTDPDQLGALLDALIEAGANVVEHVHYITLDPSPHLEAARRDAVRDGTQRARTLAEAAGRSLGPVVSMHEGQAGSPRPEPRMARMALTAEAGGFAPGENTFRIRVAMAFRLQ